MRRRAARILKWLPGPQKGISVFSVLENLTKWGAVATICALGVAISHEYGYFSVVGTHFQTVATTFDYLVNALLWLPSTTIMAFVVYGFKDWMTQPAPYEWPRFPLILVGIISVPLVVTGTLTFFYGGNFAYELAYIMSIGTVYAGLWAYAFHYSHVPWENYRSFLFIPIVFIFSFAYGTILGNLDIQKTRDVYFLKYKTDSVVKPVVMLRGFERGLLVRDHVNDRVELVRWDELVSFSRFATSKKEPTLACKLLKIGCDKMLVPRRW
jgi:hypothetical protein